MEELHRRATELLHVIARLRTAGEGAWGQQMLLVQRLMARLRGMKVEGETQRRLNSIVWHLEQLELGGAKEEIRDLATSLKRAHDKMDEDTTAGAESNGRQAARYAWPGGALGRGVQVLEIARGGGGGWLGELSL